MDSKTEPITHIYCENLAETLCGDRNDQDTLKEGYFFSQREALYWSTRKHTHRINSGPISERYFGQAPLGKLPELGEGNNYIAVPGYKYKTSICLMCNNCLAIMRLRELE